MPRRIAWWAARWLGLAGAILCAAAFLFCRWGELRFDCGPRHEIELAYGAVEWQLRMNPWISLPRDDFARRVRLGRRADLYWWRDVFPTGFGLGQMNYRPYVQRYPYLGVTSVEVPLWIPFAACVTPATAGWVRQFRRRRRNGCPRCGYELTGLPAAAPCPECGHGL